MLSEFSFLFARTAACSRRIRWAFLVGPSFSWRTHWNPPHAFLAMPHGTRECHAADSIEKHSRRGFVAHSPSGGALGELQRAAPGWTQPAWNGGARHQGSAARSTRASTSEVELQPHTANWQLVHLAGPMLSRWWKLDAANDERRGMFEQKAWSTGDVFRFLSKNFRNKESCMHGALNEVYL
jgi:hypothetical protein